MADRDFGRRQIESWSHPPIDDVGYMSSKHILDMKDDQLHDLVEKMREARYSEDGWRNYQGKWRDLMGLDTIKGKFVTDFGCGAGIESLELARAGNLVTIADISLLNLEVANRIFHLYGYRPVECIQVSMNYPYLPSHKMDVFYASGVIHHIPWADDVMHQAYENLPSGGECRLMLYSHLGWSLVSDSPPPENTAAHRDFRKFVQAYDQVGEYADWYSEKKIKKHFSDFTLERWDYLTPNDRYMGAILRKE
jgi:SAM-dependent methyltransferase